MPISITPGSSPAVVVTRDTATPVVNRITRTVDVTQVVREVVIDGNGMQGPQGEPGAGGDSVAVVRIAAADLGGHRIVRASGDGEVDYADPYDDTHGDDVLGLTTQSALAGASIQVLTDGAITEPSWNWTPGVMLWLGADGLMTHTPSEDVAFVLPVGFAETPTTVFIDIGTPIYY